MRDMTDRPDYETLREETSLTAEIMCNDEMVEKVHTLIRAAKEVERLLAEGAPRAAIGERVSRSGRERFWDRWPE